jgi:hypothetical protein
MWYFIEMDFLSKRVHDLGKLYRVSVIFSKVLFQEKENQQLVLSIGLF